MVKADRGTGHDPLAMARLRLISAGAFDVPIGSTTPALGAALRDFRRQAGIITQANALEVTQELRESGSPFYSAKQAGEIRRDLADLLTEQEAIDRTPQS